MNKFQRISYPYKPNWKKLIVFAFIIITLGEMAKIMLDGLGSSNTFYPLNEDQEDRVENNENYNRKL